MGLRAATINSSNTDEWAEVARRDRRRRDRPAAHLARAASPTPASAPRCCPWSARAAACSWSTRPTASPTGATTSAPTTAASCRVLDAPARRACPCCAARPPPTTGWSPTSSTSWATTSSSSGARSARDGLALHVLDLPAQAERLAWLAEHHPRAGRHRHRLLPHRARHRHRSPRWLRGQRHRRRRLLGRRRRRAPPARSSAALLRQRRQGRGGHLGAGHGLRQARPRLRHPLPVPGLVRSPTTSRSVGPAAASTTRSACCCGAPRTSTSRTGSSRWPSPRPTSTDRVLGTLADDGRLRRRWPTSRRRSTSGRSRLQVLLKVLEVEGAVDASGQKYRRTDQPWHYDQHRIAARHRPASGRAAADARLRHHHRVPHGLPPAACSTTPTPADCGGATAAPGADLGGVAPALVARGPRHLLRRAPRSSSLASSGRSRSTARPGSRPTPGRRGSGPLPLG